MLIRFIGAQWLATVFFSLVSFALSIVIARIFGPEKFGTYSIAYSLGALFLILIDGGFGRVLIRETVLASGNTAIEGENLQENALGHALLMMAVLCLLIALYAEPGQRPILFATVGAYCVLALGQFSLVVLRGQGRMVRDAWLQMASRSLTALFIILALLMGADDPWEVFAAQAVGGGIFATLVMRMHRVRPRFSWSLRLYRMVLPFIWLELAMLVYFRSDIVILRFLDMPKTDIGHFGIAFKIIEVILMFATPIGVMLFRRFRLNNRDIHVPVSILMWAVLAAIATGFLIAVFAYAFADVLILVFFGVLYVPAAGLLVVLCVSLVFALANIVLIQAALAWDMEKLCLRAAIAASVVSVVGNYLLIPSYGVFVAAWMSVATQATLSFLMMTGIYLATNRTQI